MQQCAKILSIDYQLVMKYRIILFSKIYAKFQKWEYLMILGHVLHKNYLSRFLFIATIDNTAAMMAVKPKTII